MSVKLDPAISREDIKALLASQSEMVYGAERTGELAGQIEHLASVLAEIAGREIELTGPPPDTSGIPERSQR
jgi:hypothetical protein